MFYRKTIKRFLDFILSLIALLLLMPLLIITGILIRIKLGKPIIFRQKRPGLNEKIFTMYKFRSMSDKKDEFGELLPDNERLNKFGLFLRKTSLDELPGLLNILKGDMSIVGPRPLAVIYLPYYNKKEKLRHSVRPGLTGLAQINGRNNLMWEERFEYDIKYVEKISFMEDLRIIILTFFKVLKKENVYIRGTYKLKDFHIYREEQQNKEFYERDR